MFLRFSAQAIVAVGAILDALQSGRDHASPTLPNFLVGHRMSAERCTGVNSMKRPATKRQCSVWENDEENGMGDGSLLQPDEPCARK
jgi:hypothetical protein